jgi:hypothetical protein
MIEMHAKQKFCHRRFKNNPAIPEIRVLFHISSLCLTGFSAIGTRRLDFPAAKILTTKGTTE